MAGKKNAVVKPLVEGTPQTPKTPIFDISKNTYECQTCGKPVSGSNIPKHNSEHKGTVVNYKLVRKQ